MKKGAIWQIAPFSKKKKKKKALSVKWYILSPNAVLL